MLNKFFNLSMTYGVGFFLLRSVSFLLLPIYTNLLSVNDAGIIFIIYTILALLNPVYAFGMDSALLKFYNSKKYSQREITSSSLIMLAVSSFSMSSLMILFSQNYTSSLLNVSFNVFYFIAIILFFDSISARLLVLLRLLEKPWAFLLIGLINIVCSFLLNILFLTSFSSGALGAIYALTIASFIQFFCLFPLLIKNIKLSLFNWVLIKKMFSFGIPFLPAAILFIITGMSDRWLIKAYLGLESVGLYGAGYKVGSAISILVLAFNLSWQPYYLKHSNDKDLARQLMEISYKFFIVLFLCCCAVSIFWPLLIKTNIHNYYLVGPEFWSGGGVIPWVAFGYFFYGLFVLQSPSIYLKNKQLWSPFFWLLGAASNIGLNVVLIPKIGVLGAAVSSLLSYLIMFVCIWYKNQEWFKNNFIDFWLFCFALAGIAIVLLNQYLLYMWASYLSFILYFIVSLLKLKKPIYKR